MNQQSELKCPANYFGKGVDYQLGDNLEEVAEYERLWREWEAKNPNDPTGEIALRKWEEKNGKPVQLTTGVAPMPVTTEISIETSKLKLELADTDIKMLKNYSSFKRRRPRDVISELIRLNCIIK